MIGHYQFGAMTVGGKIYRNDLKIIDDEVISRWWRKEGHTCDIEDVQDILASGPETLVVGMGQPGRMHVTDSLRKVLKDARIELIEQPTAEAVQTFNRLHGRGKRVAGAFHLTC